VVRQTADPYLMRIFDEDEKFKMFLSVKRFDAGVSLPTVIERAETQVHRRKARPRRWANVS